MHDRCKIFVVSVVLYLLLFVAGQNAFAGGGFASTGNWSNVATWSSGVIPGINDNAYVYYGNTLTIDTSGSCDLLQTAGFGTDGDVIFNTPGATLTAVSSTRIGENSASTMTHSAGTLNTGVFMLGSSDDYRCVGAYYLTGGASNPINTTSHAYVGNHGTGQLYLGDATNSGVINLATNKAGKELMIRAGIGSLFSNANTKIEGWGSINMNSADSYVETQGKVIANGYGTDRTLDMSTYSAIIVANNNPYSTGITNNDPTWITVKNTGTDGWYATNKGKLHLAPVTAAASAAKAWGEADSDTIPDMVNSIRMVFSSSVTGGNIDISLLASDRSELTGITGNILGAWDFQPVGNVLGSGTVDMTFRYDSALAASLGLNEANLDVYHCVGGSWQNLGGTVNTTNKLITVTGVTSFSKFVVGSVTPTETCADIWREGNGLVGDLDQNCRVDFYDLAIFISDWLK